MMKYALIENIRSAPLPRAIGYCQLCGGQVIAKCGEYKIWHWAHKSKKHCDPWWENETEWHRKWKGYFPIEYQEVIHTDELSGEKHIADIKTSNNMVIEFQNSNIKNEEIVSRENFYRKMFWIVNGDRKNTFDKNYFFLSIDTNCTLLSKDPLTVIFHWNGKSKLFEKWDHSTVPVFFDFGLDELYWLKDYNRVTKNSVIRIVMKQALIEKNGGRYNNG